MNNPIITVRDMNLWYGQTQALKNINIDIPEKSITALTLVLHEGHILLPYFAQRSWKCRFRLW